MSAGLWPRQQWLGLVGGTLAVLCSYHVIPGPQMGLKGPITCLRPPERGRAWSFSSCLPPSEKARVREALVRTRGTTPSDPPLDEAGDKCARPSGACTSGRNPEAKRTVPPRASPSPAERQGSVASGGSDSGWGLCPGDQRPLAGT